MQTSNKRSLFRIAVYPQHVGSVDLVSSSLKLYWRWSDSFRIRVIKRRVNFHEPCILVFYVCSKYDTKSFTFASLSSLACCCCCCTYFAHLLYILLTLEVLSYICILHSNYLTDFPQTFSSRLFLVFETARSE